MKKLFMAVALLWGFAASANAVVSPPVDARGNTLYTSDWSGVLPCAINTSTGTSALLCATGRGVVYGVVITSPTGLASFLVMRDTNTKNTTSSSFTAVGLGVAPAVVMGGTAMITFPRPIQFTNGLSVNMAVTEQQGEVWTVLYRPLTATE